MHRKLDSVEHGSVVCLTCLSQCSDLEQHDERAQDPITQLTPESCSLKRQELPSSASVNMAQ